MFTAALWGVTIILPELQMRKQRHRRVKSFLTDTLPAHGKAGIYLQTFLLQRPSSNMRAQLPPRPTCHSAAEDEDDSAGHKQEVSTVLPSGFARWIIQGNLWKIQSPESESPEVRAISQCLLRAKHRANCFTHLTSFHPHTNSTYVILFILFPL